MTIPYTPFEAGAMFTEHAGNNHRLILWRRWDANRPTILFIGLNPSTANADTDDHTIKRVTGFAKQFGAGGFFMLNIYSIVSANPKVLLTEKEPCVPDYDEQIKQVAEQCPMIIFCWGAFNEAIERSKAIIKMFPYAQCFGKTKNGFPKHPLYLKSNTQLIKF